MHTRILFAALLLTACGGAEKVSKSETPVAAETPAAKAPEVRQVLSSDRIYYELTRYGWYGRGEPLVHEQTGYQPVGAPVAASLEEMKRIGEYQGVEYYRRNDDALSIYVPVFDGYWLAFRATDRAAQAD